MNTLCISVNAGHNGVATKCRSISLVRFYRTLNELILLVARQRDGSMAPKCARDRLKRTSRVLSPCAIMREIGRKGGKIGGKRSLETMTPEERAVRAKKASLS